MDYLLSPSNFYLYSIFSFLVPKAYKFLFIILVVTSHIAKHFFVRFIIIDTGNTQRWFL